MKVYILPDKYIKRVLHVDLTCSLFIIASGIFMMFDFSFSAILMVLMGILALSMASTRSNRMIRKIILNDEHIEYVANIYRKKITFKEITRLSFARKPLKIKSIRGLIVSDKNYYGFIDLRINESIELIERIMSKRPDLVSNEMKDLWDDYKDKYNYK